MEQNTSLIIKFRFEERNKNFLGFVLIIVDPKGFSVIKTAAAINYFSERFHLLFNLSQPWPSFLTDLENAQDTIREMLPKDYAAKLERLYESYPLERLEMLIDAGVRETNEELKLIRVETLLKDDLGMLFPKGDLHLEFTIEPVEMEASPPADGPEGEDVETITLAEVNPVIDPHHGISAEKLKLDAIIMVKMQEQTDTHIKCRVVAVMMDKKHPNEVLVSVDLSGGMWGQMTVPRFTMIQTAEPLKPPEKNHALKPQDLTFLAILALAVLAFVAAIIAFFTGFWS